MCGIYYLNKGVDSSWRLEQFILTHQKEKFKYLSSDSGRFIECVRVYLRCFRLLLLDLERKEKSEESRKLVNSVVSINGLVVRLDLI